MQRTHSVSPEHPSRRATMRVTNPLPVPTVCPYCQGAVRCVSNSLIYGREYGDWPYAYRCSTDGCGAYVGLHPFTNIPLGTLANAELREARKEAKAAFNPIWQGQMTSRSDAYAWLADALRIPAAECHFGWFDVERCLVAKAVCERRRARKL